jgi:mono/diheme cytochrome c family protein
MRTALPIVLALLAAAPALAEPDDVSRGRAAALQLCSGCHFVEPGQRIPLAVGAPPFPALANDPAVTEFRLRSFLRTPHPVMPMLILSAEETDSIIAFVMSLKRR